MAVIPSNRRIDITELFSPFNQVIPQHTNTYPPYNFYKLNNDLFIEMAVAGFSKDELTVDYDGYKLSVSGKKDKKPVDGIQYFSRGLAYRNFQQDFTIQGRYDIGGVSLVNGVLIVKLKNSISESKLDIQISDSFPESWLPKEDPKLLEE